MNALTPGLQTAPAAIGAIQLAQKPASEVNNQSEKPQLGLPVLGGLSVVGLVFGGFLGWASIAPLDSAAIAPGFVTVDSNRKAVQHLEGGIVRTIHVKEGDVVEAGTVLVELEDTQAQATLSLLKGRRIEALALTARLQAERNWSAQIEFPQELDNTQAKANQQRIFETRTVALKSQIAIIDQSVTQYEKEIEGIQAQRRAERTQLALTREELRDKETLARKRLAKKSQILDLKRRVAELEGGLGENSARIARTRQSIAEAKLRIVELKSNATAEAAAQLRESMTELRDLEERLGAAKDVVDRTIIYASRNGIVVNLDQHTIGGIVSPGATLMEIVPSGDRLVIEASVSPSDIDVVQIGKPVMVRLTAYSQRSTKPLEGEVIALSADGIKDERSGETFYKARVALNKHDDAITLKPGMQAEVLIITGERTLLDYLMSPVGQSFSRAMTEQ